MKKGTKSLGGFIVVTLSAILIIAAIIAAAFYSEVVIPEPETQALAAGEEYVHGSNIGRTPSGNDVTTGEQLVNAINNNNNVNLLNDVWIPSGSFGSIAVYSGTIYGNGHKITINVPDSSGKNDRGRQFFGGLMGELKDGGAIYDCTFDIGSGDYKGGYNDNTFFGAVTGSIYNATVENVTVNILSGTDFRIYCHSSGQQVGIGMLSGYAGIATIRNVTINNNGGTYRAGYSNSAFDTIYTEANPSTVANLVGFFEGSTSTVENIIIKGGTASTTLDGQYASNLGLSAYAATTITVGNFYNAFLGNINAVNNGGSVTFAKHISTSWGSTSYVGNVSVTRYFEYHNSDSDCVNQLYDHREQYNRRTITEKLSVQTSGNDNVVNRQILFNPRTTDYANSLVLIYTNRELSNAIVGKQWTVTADSGRIFNGTEDGDGIVFVNLPVADIWNDDTWGDGNGYFNATLSSSDLTKAADLTEYDHGYVEGHNSSTTGTALNNANFESALNSSENSDSGVTKTYYLTSDILVSGFTNRTLSSVNLDGNGYTIYITGTGSSLGGTDIGGLAGLLNDSTIKNLRIVVTESMTINATNAEGSRYSGSKTLGIGILAGRITGNALVENVQVYIPEGITVTGTASNNDCSLGGLAGNMSGRGRVSNCTVKLDGTLYCRRSYPFVAGFVGNTEDPNFTSDGTDTIAFNYNNIIFKGAGYLSGEHTNTGGTEKLYVAAITITDQIGSYNGKWIDIDGFIYAFSDNPIPTTTAYSMYGFVTQNHNGDSSLTNASDSKPMGSYITASNIFTATSYTAVKNGNDKGNTYWNIPTNAAISGSVTNLDGSTVTPYFRPGSDDNITLVASGTGVSGFNGVLKEKGATIGEGKDSIPAAAKDGDNLVLEMPKADVVSESDTSVGLEEAKTVTLTTGINKSFTYSGRPQARDVYLKYGESSISDYTVTYAAESGSELSNAPINVGSYYISVVALTENAGDYYFFDTTSNTLSKSYTYASVDENSNKFVIKPAEVNLAFSGSMTVTYDAKAVENPEVSVSGGTFGQDLGELTYVWMNADGTETLSANPTNAGSYKVKISAVANPNFTVGGAAADSGNVFTIKAKEVTLSVEEGGTSFAFAQDKGAITSANVNANDTYGLTINGFIDSDTNAAYTVSLASPVYIEENGTSNAYLAAGEYNLTVTLSSPNYTFGTNSNTVSVTVLKNAGANRFTTEYQRAGWTYYSDPTELSATPVARFGTVNAVVYTDSTGETVDPFSKTTPVGTYTATVTVDGNDSYDALSSEYTFDISQLTVSITGISAETVDYTTAAYAGNITITIDGYSAEDVAAILGEITYKHRLASATEAEYIKGLPTDAGEYAIGIHELGNMTAGNISVSDLDAITADLVINKKTVAFEATEAKNAALYYGQNISDFSGLISVTHEDMTGYDFEKADWRYSVTSDFTSTTTANTPVTLTVKIFVDDPNYSVAEGDGEFVLNNIKVSKADIVIEVNISDKEYDGGELEATATETSVVTGDATGSDITIIYYKVNTAETGEGRYTELDSAPTAAGTYAVRATVAGQDNYNAAATEYIEFTISKAEQSVQVTMDGWVFNNPANKPVIVGIKEDADTTVTYSGETNAGTEYDTPETVPTQAGNYKVHVSWKETTNYKAGSAEPVSFTIAKAKGKADITITYSVDGGTDAPYTGETMLYYNGSAYTFKVAVEYFEKDGGTLTTEINGNPGDNLTATYAGTHTVSAKVSASPNYSEATATAEIEILRAVIQSVTLGTTEFAFGTLNTENADDASTYGTADVAFVEYKGSVSPKFTYSLAYSKTENGNDKKAYIVVGEEYTLTLALTGETAANFVFDGGDTATTVKVQVIKGDVNTWTSQDKIDGYVFGFEGAEVIGKAKFGTAAVTYYREGEAIEFSDAAQGVPAGTYTAVVSVPGNGNYEGISYEYTFVVEKHDLNITDLTIKGTESTEVSGSAADGFTVTYAPGMVLSATVTVSSGEDGFSAPLYGLIGDADSHKYFFEYRAEDSDEWFDRLPPNAGIYIVRFKGMELAAKYDINNFAFVYEGNARELTTKLTINKATVSASAELKGDIVYGMTLEEVRELVQINYTDTALDYEVDIAVKVGDTDYTGAVNAGTAVSITVKITVNDPNYTATVSGDTEYTLTVQKKAVKIAVDEKATMLHANYNQFDPTPFYGHIRIDGLQNGDVKENVFNIALPVVSDTPTTDVYEVNVSLNTDFAGYDNYDFGDTSEWVISLTLSAREFTFTVQMKGSFVYGKEIDGMELVIVQPEGEEEIPSSVLHQPMTFRYIGVDGTEYDSDIAPVNVGKYTLTVTITGTADYHSEPATSNVFEITPAPLTMTIDAAAGGLSTTYDPDPDTEITDFMAEFAEYFTVAFPADGAYTDEFGDIFSLSATKVNEGAVESIKNAGKYTLTPTLINKNYSITDIPSLTYTVNKANMSVTVSVASWAYGEYSSEINAPVISGIMEDAYLLEGYSVVYTLTSDDGYTPIDNIAAADVGEYTVTVTVPKTDNYNGTTAKATFSITKTTFTSSVTITGWTYDEYDAKLNAPSVTENPGNADVRYTYTGRNGTEYAESDLVPENAGYYTVTAYIAESNNYSAVTVICDFAIVKASVSPAIDAELSKTYDGDAVAFTLTEGSNPGMGEVTYVIEREISGEYVTVTEARYSGNYRVRATVSETANYSGATTGYVTFAIGQKAVTASWSVADAALVYGDGYDEALALIVIDKEAVLAQFAAGDGEYVEFLLAATVADGSDYSERVNADTAVTFGLSIAFAEGTAQDIVGSYSISVTGAGSKTVAPRSIEIAATDTSDVYGSSFTADGSLAEYFAENFTYNGTSVNAIAGEYTTVVFAVNGSNGAAIPNAGTYTVTVTVGGNYTGAASAAYTINQKTLTVAAGYELPFGVLNAENIAEYGYEALLGGFVGDESVDYTVRADDELGDEDSSFGFLNIGKYVLTVEIAENTNYTFETGYTAKFTVNIEKTDNAWIVEYARGDWTYLSEPAAVTSPEARFAESDIDVRYYADSGYTVEMAPEAFTAVTPAGTYYVTVSVPGSDNFYALRAEYSFEIYRLRAEMEVSTPEAVYDGEPYDGLTYTVSGAAADVVGEIGWMYIGEGMSDYVPGLPVNAGSYIIKLLNYSDSENINLLSEPVSVVISPAPMNFTVTGAAYASVEYGTDPDEIDLDALIASVVPDSDIGSFTFTVNLLTAKGREYTDSTYAGTVLYACVEITVTNGNFYAVVPEEVEDFPAVNVVRKAHDISLEVDDEIVTDGNEITVAEGIDVNLIDAIASYMSKNGVKYYDYVVTVDGESYNRDMVWTPGEHEVIVRLSGNHEGEASFTVMVEESLEPAKEPFVPATKVGEVLESINFTWASAVSIGFGVAVAVLIILFFGLRRSKKK